MKSRLILTVAAAAIALAAPSCTPWVEPNPPMPPGGDIAGRQMQPDEVDPNAQARLKDKRDRMKERQEQEQRDDRNVGNNNGQTAGPGPEAAADPKPEPAPKKVSSVPTAMKVPGKPGMVFSPFNNKLIDVSGMASGTVVADPTYPDSEKKHFKVP